jgi:hypothetical protein
MDNEIEQFLENRRLNITATLDQYRAYKNASL